MRSLLQLVGIVAAVYGLIGSSAGLAQSYPGPTVTIVVPFPPGGGLDPMTRLVAERLAPRLAQNVIVINRPGANGMIGAEYVARAAPDGRTILFGSTAEVAIAPLAFKEMRYDPVRDLEPVTLAATTPLALVAHPSAGVKTFPELIARAKREPGKLSYGSPGTGSSQHLAGEWIKKLANINLVHIPYKGGGPVTVEVLAGHIPFAIVGIAPLLPHIRQGKLVPVAVMSRERVLWANDVPTVSETPGMEDFEVSHWFGVLVPAGTPAALVQRLQSEIAAILKTPEFGERLVTLGMDPVGNTTAEFRKFLAAERDKFAKISALIGLTPQ